jgi:hypothetical protein
LLASISRQALRCMRRLAWALVVTGLVIGLAGVFRVIIQDELLARGLLGAPSDDALRLAEPDLSIWPAVGIGTAIAGFGLLLLGLGPLCVRLIRRVSRGRAGSTRGLE